MRTNWLFSAALFWPILLGLVDSRPADAQERQFFDAVERPCTLEKIRPFGAFSFRLSM